MVGVLSGIRGARPPLKPMIYYAMSKLGDYIRYSPDPAGVILHTGIDRFESASGIDGLARETGDHIELLAVVARNPGTGQLRNFITKLQSTFTKITVMHVSSAILEAALIRYGFQPITFSDEWDKDVPAWRWNKCY